MKVGVVSNVYPPCVYGGYEIGCGQVVDGLRARGMDVQVLTSSRCPREGRDYVHNTLHDTIGVSFSRMNPIKKLAYLIRHEASNLRAFRAFLRSESPDVVYFWNVSHTSRSLIAEAKSRGLRTGLFAFDHGLCEGTSDAWFAQSRPVPGQLTRTLQRWVLKLAAYALRRPPDGDTEFDFIHYPTDYLRRFLEQNGMRAKVWTKIPWGVDTEKFRPAASPPTGRLLYVGQLAQHKGVHVALEALGLLAQSAPDLEWSLTIAGQCLDARYQAKLDELIARYDLGRRVHFAGFVSREDLPELYREHSILLFPSIWDEPMGISILEAMASGLCVISSGTGGSGELYREGVSGLTCQPNNAEDWCCTLREVLSSAELAGSLGKQANAECVARAQFSGTVAAVEKRFLAPGSA